MEYHHHQVQLHCRVCVKRMYDRRANKKGTVYKCEAYTQALQKVFGMAAFQTEEDAMMYPQSFCSSCKRSLQKAMDSAAQGVPYRCCVTAFQWLPHRSEPCMVRCFTPSIMTCACILMSLNPHMRCVNTSCPLTKWEGHPKSFIQLKKAVLISF